MTVEKSDEVLIEDLRRDAAIWFKDTSLNDLEALIARYQAWMSPAAEEVLACNLYVLFDPKLGRVWTPGTGTPARPELSKESKGRYRAAAYHARRAVYRFVTGMEPPEKT